MPNLGLNVIRPDGPVWRFAAAASTPAAAAAELNKQLRCLSLVQRSCHSTIQRSSQAKLLPCNVTHRIDVHFSKKYPPLARMLDHTIHFFCRAPPSLKILAKPLLTCICI